MIISCIVYIFLFYLVNFQHYLQYCKPHLYILGVDFEVKKYYTDSIKLFMAEYLKIPVREYVRRLTE